MANKTYLNDLEMSLEGNLPSLNEKAPDFSLTAQDLSDMHLSDFKGRRVVLNIFPSLDTEVCAASVRKFNVMATELDNTSVICVSADLPFAASRFCVANGIKDVHTGSTFRSSFGRDYGVKIADGPMRGLMARAVIVIDEEGYVKGVSLCEAITSEPDYDYVLSILKA